MTHSKPDAPFFERIALVGIGLIGSSISLAARRAGLVGEVIGCARSAATRDRALELGLVDHVFADPREAVEGADLIVLCSPVGTFSGIAEAISTAISPGCIVTDVGSVKGAVVRDVGPHVPDNAHFVPCHPVAGTEYSGPDAGFAELFDNRWCILTPPAGADPAAVEKLDRFWQLCGAKTETMDANHHDLVLAITSHVPHLIAYNIVGTAEDLETVTQSEVIKYSAGGFRDFTRIAASDPVMWRDIFLNNKEAVLEMLGRFNEDLSALQRAIRWSDGDALESLFSRTRTIRQGIIDAGQETPEADFGRGPEQHSSGDES